MAKVTPYSSMVWRLSLGWNTREMMVDAPT